MTRRLLIFLLGISLLLPATLLAADLEFDPVRQNFGAGNGPCAVRIGDFNLDGKPDLAVANFSGDNVSILLGNGNGTFQAAVNSWAGNGPIFVAIGDFNLDGKPD